MPLDVADIQGPFARLAQLLAVVSALLATVAWILHGDNGMLAVAVSAWVTALLSVVMNRTGHAEALVLLGGAAVGLSIAGRVTEVTALAAFSSLALVFVGIAALVFLRGRAGWFVVAYSLFLGLVHVVWVGIEPQAFAEGGLTVVAFLAGSLSMRWLRDRSLDSASRFSILFDRAPVSLWEEDYSKVGEWLGRLRSNGVVDLRAHLEENRDALAEGVSLVEVVRVNQEAARLLEVDDPSDLVGALIPATLSEAALLSMVEQFEAIWHGRDHVAVELRHGLTARGNPLHGLLHWTVPRRFGQPDLSRVIVSIVDITEMNEARQEMERLLQSKEELIATVSHELRTPLTTVVGLSTELIDAFDSFSRDEILDLLRMVADQGIELATIVEDLLVAARTESGSLKVSLESVDLHLEAKITLRGLEIEQDVDCHAVGVVPPAFADRGRVRQILRNLIVNARRYGSPPFRVVVLEDGDRVSVEVRDGGTPIPEDERERIFDRYYRARQTPGMTASVGLGLTVSRELARLMGGDLTYHHDGESIFTLILPRRVALEVVETA